MTKPTNSKSTRQAQIPDELISAVQSFLAKRAVSQKTGGRQEEMTAELKAEGLHHLADILQERPIETVYHFDKKDFVYEGPEYKETYDASTSIAA